MPAKIFCGYCGKKNKPTYSFCTGCGEPLEKIEGNLTATQSVKPVEKWREQFMDHETLKKEAKQGLNIAQYNLGVMYLEGKGVEQDKEKAFKWFMKAATQNNGSALFKVGFMYKHGMGIDKDQEEALIYYAKSEEQGYNTFLWRKNLLDEIEALEEEEKIKLAEKLVKDRQLQIEFQRECEFLEINEKNLELYNISNRKKIERLTCLVKILLEDVKWEDDDYNYINQDTLKRITNIRKVIKNLEKKEDEEEGQPDLFRDLNAGGKETVKRALMGYDDDQFLLGEVHYHGIGTEKNEEQAFKWFMGAAINEDTEAQYMVGKMCRDGQGVDKDLRQAFKWFKKAAKSDNAAAQYMVGMAYHRGEGIYKDREQAIKWIMKANEQRYSKAQEILKKI